MSSINGQLKADLQFTQIIGSNQRNKVIIGLHLKQKIGNGLNNVVKHKRSNHINLIGWSFS
jgi:hypothetical protein